MKAIISFVGILLVIFGIAVLGYTGFTYTKQEKIAEVGNVKITADTQKTVYFSPVTGLFSLACGIVFIVIGRVRP